MCHSPTENVYGILSIFFWTLTAIVSLKYVVLVLRADNNGEGGLGGHAGTGVAVSCRTSLSCGEKSLLIVGIFGTCLFYGDGVITPAISVLSAVEGLEVVSPTLSNGLCDPADACSFCSACLPCKRKALQV
jgi:KUP system potassium uptake protein